MANSPVLGPNFGQFLRPSREHHFRGFRRQSWGPDSISPWTFFPKPLCFWDLLFETPEEDENTYGGSLKKQSATNGLVPRSDHCFCFGASSGNYFCFGARRGNYSQSSGPFPFWGAAAGSPKSSTGYPVLDLWSHCRESGNEDGLEKTTHGISGGCLAPVSRLPATVPKVKHRISGA